MNNWDINERNLRRVYDYCIRRGIQIDASFHDDSINYINSCLLKIKHQKTISKEQFDSFVAMISSCEVLSISEQTKSEIDVFLELLEPKTQEAQPLCLKPEVRKMKAILTHVKNDVLSGKFSQYCLKLNKRHHDWNLVSYHHIASGKDIYSIGNGFDYLVSRIIQESIKEKYDIRVGNRISIIKQLKCLLDDRLPKAIVRTDIKSFFETINAKLLISHMDNMGLVQKSQINMLSGLIEQYNRISGCSLGVPRGVGISSYLAELYMKEIDKEIKRQPNVIYYARFVDDMVIVTSEKESGNDDNAKQVFDLLKNKLKEIGLEAHDSGEKFCICPNSSLDFTYLGYRFVHSGGKLEIDISSEKQEKIKTKIRFAFVSFYNNKSEYKSMPYKKKLHDLKERLECLTCAVHVRGMHKRVEIGTPVTYSEITRRKSLAELNRYYRNLLKKSANQDLSNLLSGINFVNGFYSNEIKDISNRKYKSLSRIWVHL